MTANWGNMESNQYSPEMNYQIYYHQFQQQQQQQLQQLQQQQLQQQQQQLHQQLMSNNQNATVNFSANTPTSEQIKQERTASDSEDNDSGIFAGQYAGPNFSPKSNQSLTEETSVSSPNANSADQTNVGSENNEVSHNDSPKVTLLVCPSCPFSTTDKFLLSEHLVIHFNNPDLDKIELTKSVIQQFHLDSNMSETGSTSPRSSVPEEDARISSEREANAESENAANKEYDLDSSVTQPQMNSHGKVKTFRCKQCDFVAITKLDYWKHTRVHIKTDKILTCPKCPFATEYKHHLEYHLRNHLKSKPFKCDKCSYSCVNKSMLSSHSKSHSNVYPYRCGDCSYATKYHHMLKDHLQKKSHRQQVMFNSDGIPDPTMLIDVYGTKRGPKRKANKMEESFTESLSINTNFSSPLASNNTALPPLSHWFNQSNALANGFVQNGIGANGGGLLTFANPLGLPNPLNNPHVTEQMKNWIENSMAYSKSQDFKSNKSFEDYGPLDLSSPENSPRHKDSDDCILDLSLSGNRAKPIEKRMRRRQSEETLSASSGSPAPSSNGDISSEAESLNDFHGRDVRVRHSEDKYVRNAHTCQYCQITFSNELMYTVHMGYHGYENPFKCNMCGVSYDDSIAFFVHIARVQH